MNHHSRMTEKTNKRLERQCKEIQDDNKRLNDAKFTAIQEKTVATNAVSALTREIEYLRKQADEDRSKLEGLDNKKEKFKSSLDAIQQQMQRMEETKKTNEATISTLREQALANKKVQEQLSNET